MTSVAEISAKTGDLGSSEVLVDSGTTQVVVVLSDVQSKVLHADKVRVALGTSTVDARLLPSGAWIAGFPASASTAGEKTLTASAHGLDQSGAERTWMLGSGTLKITAVQNAPTAFTTVLGAQTGTDFWYGRVFRKGVVPTTPAAGDICFFDSFWRVYDGSSWSALGASGSLPDDVIGRSDLASGVSLGATTVTGGLTVDGVAVSSLASKSQLSSHATDSSLHLSASDRAAIASTVKMSDVQSFETRIAALEQAVTTLSAAILGSSLEGGS